MWRGGGGVEKIEASTKFDAEKNTETECVWGGGGWGGTKVFLNVHTVPQGPHLVKVYSIVTNQTECNLKTNDN